MINTLPPELRSIVFNFVPIHQLPVLKQVCKSWLYEIEYIQKSLIFPIQMKYDITIKDNYSSGYKRTSKRGYINRKSS